VQVDSTAPANGSSSTGTGEPPRAIVAAHAGPAERVALGRIVGARSGDKGGDANLGVFTRTAEVYSWIADQLTVDRLRELLPETAGLEIDRYELPNLWSLNFVIHDLLEEGVAASSRIDGQAKSLGEWLRARIVEVPVDLL
jgi:hypothetical protein